MSAIQKLIEANLARVVLPKSVGDEAEAEQKKLEARSASEKERADQLVKVYVTAIEHITKRNRRDSELLDAVIKVAQDPAGLTLASLSDRFLTVLELVRAWAAAAGNTAGAQLPGGPG